MSNAKQARQLGVKLYVNRDTAEVDLEPLIPIFHRWIQNDTLSGETVIDVVDYRHVHQGPGVMLVCDGSSYALDSAKGTLGLLYVRNRRREESLEQQLRKTLSQALTVARLLEQESSSKLTFATDHLLVRFQDRLQAPQTAETQHALESELQALAARLFASADATVTAASEDPRELFAVDLASAASSAAGVDTLLQRLAE